MTCGTGPEAAASRCHCSQLGAARGFERLCPARLLEVLERTGVLLSQMADADGMLIVNVPFCGRFQEYAMLGHFLAEHCLSLPGVRGAKIFATDTSDKCHFEWAVAQRWFSEFYPTIEALKLRACFFLQAKR